MSGKSNWIFLLSLGSLGGCDDASSIPPCNPERLGRECNDVDPDASEGTPIDSNTSGASDGATSGADGSDTFDSGNDTATASDTASASETADAGTSGGDYGSTGYGSSGYGSSGSGSSGSSSSGYYAQSDYAELGLADLEENGCLSGLDCGVLSEVRR